MNIYDLFIDACPLYVVNNVHVVDVDLNAIRAIEEDILFDEWFIELVALCGNKLTVNFHYNGTRTTVVY